MRILQRVRSLAEVARRAVSRIRELRVQLSALVAQLRSDGLGDGLLKGLANGLLKRRGARVRDFGGHRIELFVNLVVQRGLVILTLEKAHEVLAELGRDRDGCEDVAATHGLGRLVRVHELPAQLVVVVQLVHELSTHVEVARKLRVRAAVLVDHGDLEVFRIFIGIPERAHVEPRVERRRDKDADGDDPYRRRAPHAREISVDD